MKNRSPERAVATAPLKASSPDSARRLQDEVREGLRAVEVKNRFMTRITHELRNTLATMKTAAYCLRDGVAGPLLPRQARMVEIISRNVDRQARIIDNVLDLAHFRSGKFHVRLAPLDVTDVLAEIVQDFGLERGGPKLTVAFEGRLPPVNADADLVGQLLRNLVGNAMRYAVDEVRVTASAASPDGVRVVVADDGPGIPASALPRIFDRYYQVSSEDRRHGLGLGLTFCRAALRAMGGEVSVESEEGRGSVFTLRLPRGRAGGDAS